MRIIVGIDSDPFTASYLPEDMVLWCIYLTKLRFVEPMTFLKGQLLSKNNSKRI